MDVLIPIIAIISTIFIPVTGLMLILVSRLALKPMVETLSQALRDSRQPDPASMLQVQELTDRVFELTEEVRKLQEAQDFDRKLLGVTESGSAPPASD
ncbi:MAG: hypothetical protein RLN75_05390 [Longimicrobiales bacterium]